MRGEFTIVEPKTHLAYSVKAWVEGQEEKTQIDQVTELTLSEQDGKTKLNLRAAINKMGSAAQMAVEGMQHGFAQELDKLKVFLSDQK